jgi:curved DNA-binding protein CbpA
MNLNALPIPDPYAVLGLGPGAEDEQIRAAYLAKLKQFPPDRSPAEFEQEDAVTSEPLSA